MLSQKARYALHALIVLAQHDGEEPMQIADVAEEARVPRKFLEQILVDLKRRGIVRSQRGRAGGYFIGKPAKEISFGRRDPHHRRAAGAGAVRVRDRLPQMRGLRTRRRARSRKVLMAARDATADVLGPHHRAGGGERASKVGWG